MLHLDLLEAMNDAHVIERPRRLERVSRDTFIDGLCDGPFAGGTRAAIEQDRVSHDRQRALVLASLLAIPGTARSTHRRSARTPSAIDR
jgi:hypothetical protein